MKYIVTGILLIGIIVYLYQYRNSWLTNIIYYLVIEAEGKYKSKEGQEKLSYVVAKVKEKLPSYLRWIVSEKLIKSFIENILANLQKQFKGTVEKQLSVVNKAIEIHRMKNDITFDLEYMKEQIETRGYIEGFINTDFKENTVAGIKAGMKF